MLKGNGYDQNKKMLTVAKYTQIDIWCIRTWSAMIVLRP
jgi:hypothetical protein